VVGDPQQAIHGFAGARADCLTGFASDALRELVGLGAENATARDALSLLYRLSGGLA